MKQEYEKELQMTYSELCDYLKEKYGEALFDYFSNPECKSKNRKVSRTSEGLFCHHVFEDKYDNLGNLKMARTQPFDAQRKENLVYCNYIEHLILHLKINANAKSLFLEAFEINYFFNSKGFIWIANEINDLFKNNGSHVEWRNNCFNAIKDDFYDYVSILKGTLCFIDKNYLGDKARDIKVGDELVTDIIDAGEKEDLSALRGHQYNYKRFSLTVVKISKKDDIALLTCLDHNLKQEDLLTLGIMDLNYGFIDVSNNDAMLLRYRYSMLKKKYDFERLLTEKKNEIISLSDGTKWVDLDKQLNLSFGKGDMEVAKMIEASLVFE